MTVSATFGRTSVAYKKDGTQVASGVPRYETGTLMIEETTTPIILDSFFLAYTGTPNDNIEDTFTNWTKFGTATGRIEAVTDSAFGGIAIKCTQTDATGANQIYGVYEERTLADMGLSEGDKISLQTRYKMGAQTNSHVSIRVTIIGPNTTTYIVNEETAAVGSYTVKKSENITVPVGATSIQFYVYVKSSGVYSGGNNWVEADFFCAEKKAYYTSPVDVTRAAETTTIPSTIFTKGNSVVDMIFNPTSNQVVTGKTGYLWECLIDAQNYYRILVHATGRPYLAVASGGVEVTTYNAGDSILALDTNYRITAKINGSTMCLLINNVKTADGDVAYTEPVGSLPINTYLGSDSAGANQANGLYDDFNILSKGSTEYKFSFTDTLDSAQIDSVATYRVGGMRSLRN